MLRCHEAEGMRIRGENRMVPGWCCVIYPSLLAPHSWSEGEGCSSSHGLPPPRVPRESCPSSAAPVQSPCWGTGIKSCCPQSPDLGSEEGNSTKTNLKIHAHINASPLPEECNTLKIGGQRAHGWQENTPTLWGCLGSWAGRNCPLQGHLS